MASRQTAVAVIFGNSLSLSLYLYLSHRQRRRASELKLSLTRYFSRRSANSGSGVLPLSRTLLRITSHHQQQQQQQQLELRTPAGSRSTIVGRPAGRLYIRR